MRWISSLLGASLIVVVSTISMSQGISVSGSLIDVTPRPPMFYDMAGNLIHNSTVGYPVMILTNFTNAKQVSQSVTFLFEVRDANGVTQYLAWQITTAPPMGTKSAGVSWISDEAGEYQIRMFVLSNLTNPQVLSPVETANFIVMAPKEEKKAVGLELNGTEYDTQYTLGSGFIKNVIVQQEISTLPIVFEGVHKNTMLTLIAPDALIVGSVHL